MKSGIKFPDHIGISEVTTRSFEHMRVESYFEGQPSLMFDEPEGFDITDGPDDKTKLSGRSRGWTPVHAQLAALAGCTSITVAVVARDQKFRLKGLSTKLRSLIDIRGFFFDLHLRPQYEQLDFDLILDTKESVKSVRALATETHRRCPQLGLFALAKIPLVVGWYRAGDAAPLFEERLHCPDGPLPAERLAAEAKRRKRKSAA